MYSQNASKVICEAQGFSRHAWNARSMFSIRKPAVIVSRQGLLEVGVVEGVELDLVAFLVEEPVHDVAVPVHVRDQELSRLELEGVSLSPVVLEHLVELGAVLTCLGQGLLDLGRPRRRGHPARQHQGPDQHLHPSGSAHDLLPVG
ncbi:MAG: hypothetical protein ACYTAQ_04765 [Planctomycetota bacterium]|jgi:hypothetical protein